MIDFRLPSLGAEMDEGTLIEWKVKVGDHVRKGDVVAVIDTSKSAIDVEVWEEGTVAELLLRPGTTVPVGTVIARLQGVGEAAITVVAIAPAAVPPSPATLPAGGARDVAPSAPPTAATAPPPPWSRARASPAARKRAQELGVALDAVMGTGPDGAIGIADVERAAAAPPVARDRAADMRRAIAAAMARSKREIPHYYLATDIPVERARAWLEARNAGLPITRRVLMAAVLLKAVALALRRHPKLNGFHRDGAFVPGDGIHVGVAISIRGGGLVAPALKDADALALDDLMQRLADLVARARAFTLRSSEVSAATVTVSNLGEQGVRLVEGIIYPPQVALVGFGGVAQRPWVEDGKLVVSPVVTASLAADHRVSDGHQGALFLDELARLLQQPERL